VTPTTVETVAVSKVYACRAARGRLVERGESSVSNAQRRNNVRIRFVEPRFATRILAKTVVVIRASVWLERVPEHAEQGVFLVRNAATVSNARKVLASR
jgi:hypothetical protein